MKDERDDQDLLVPKDRWEIGVILEKKDRPVNPSLSDLRDIQALKD